jgi:hypothetical protein
LRKLPKRSPMTNAASWKIPDVPTQRVYGLPARAPVWSKTVGPDLNHIDGRLCAKSTGGGVV